MSDFGVVEVVLAVLLGAVTGTISGAFSMGGGVLQQPGIRLLGGTPFEAIGTTTPVLIPMAVSAIVRYARSGLVSGRVAAWVVPAGLIGSVIGPLSTRLVPGDGHLLQLMTAALLARAAISIMRPDRNRARRLAPGEPTWDPNVESWALRIRLVVLGIVAGTLGGLLGIGGGVILVPGLHRVVGMPLRRAIATSLLAVGFLAIPSALTHHTLGGVEWPLVGLLSIGVVPGAWLGAHLTSLAGRRAVAVATGTVLLLLAMIYGIEEITSLLAIARER
ncbi:MAG: sulfite exporter TauE/SafE family protein [Nitriliruptoraceae bacterium]